MKVMKNKCWKKKTGKVQTLWKNLLSRFTPAGWAHKALDDIHVYMHTRMCEHQYWFSIICFFDPRVSKQKCVCVCVHPAHLPMKDNTPDEAQGQLVVPIHNICPSYVYQIHLKGGQTKLLKNITSNQINICEFYFLSLQVINVQIYGNVFLWGTY